MFTVKRGREIKSRNSFHWKLLKHAWEDEYVAVELDQEGLDASRRKKLKPGKTCVCNPTTSVYPVKWQLAVHVTSLMVHRYP